MKTTVLRRSELYRQVWERTLAALGAEMGISDNGLNLRGSALATIFPALHRAWRA